MRFEKGHKEQTRQRIVETAARRFRKEGLEAVGIAGLMADAGLTHGGFYAHFASKEHLVRAALNEALDQNQTRRAKALEQAPSGPEALEALVRLYLRPAHRDTPERGCAVATLIAEVARHEQETRAVLSARLASLLNQIASTLPAEMTADEKERRAIGIFGVMLGTLQMARVVTDMALSDRILESGLVTALTISNAVASQQL
ncbi:MAG: hypothetical protein B7X08_03095 [Acidocella sp. 20-63-7]|nr:MAG: hypothetical protein B7X08_03095 [Acidocella sp. 20-63-7]HQT46947.1 TetR/AcrR family transcriptional regulator [Acidocella sp.]